MRRAVGEKQEQCSPWLVVQSGSLWPPAPATAMQPQEKKWRESITQSLRSKVPAHQALWATDQQPNPSWNPVFTSLNPLSLSVPYPPLWLLLTRVHYGLLFSFMLDIHPPYISAWTAPSLFTLCLAGGLSHTFSKSKLISLIVTGEWQELCGGNVSLSTRSQTPLFFSQICVLNFWQADLSHWTFHRHRPTSCPLNPSLSW